LPVLPANRTKSAGRKLRAGQCVVSASVPVASTGATGLLANVTYVQRVNTSGGVEANTCDAAHEGVVDKVPYSANYYFFISN
jgi:hypothetical protein